LGPGQQAPGGPALCSGDHAGRVWRKHMISTNPWISY
jgi:hypothetical protein